MQTQVCALTARPFERTLADTGRQASPESGRPGGGTLKNRLDLVKGGRYSMPAGKLKGLADDPDVAYISPDRAVRATMDYSRSAVLSDIAQNYGWKGTGVTDEIYGHGTHVAGIIAGIGKDSSGKYQGIATSANIINLRALDDKGVGKDSAVIAAIQEAIAQKSKYNIRVINLSLGRPVQESYKTDPLCQSVESAWKAGIVVVVAAGNAGRDGSQGTAG